MIKALAYKDNRNQKRVFEIGKNMCKDIINTEYGHLIILGD